MINATLYVSFHPKLSQTSMIASLLFVCSADISAVIGHTLGLVDSILRLNSRIWCDYSVSGLRRWGTVYDFASKSNTQTQTNDSFSHLKSIFIYFKSTRKPHHFVWVDLKYHIQKMSSSFLKWWYFVSINDILCKSFHFFQFYSESEFQTC